MGIKEKTKHRSKVLDDIAEYILENGSPKPSLRSLAISAKTSPQTLLRLFGSKGELMCEVLDKIRLCQDADLAHAISATESPEKRLLGIWNAWCSPRMRHYWGFWLGAYGLALRNPERYAKFLKHINGSLPLLERIFVSAGSSPERARGLATLSLAVIRGMQLDVLTSRDQDRIDAAFERLLSVLALAPNGQA